MCAAFGTFPFPVCISSVYILHIWCRLLPTCIGSFHVFIICQMCPLPSCICSFYSSSICNFCIFSTCILLSHFFCNCHVCLFQICIFQFHFFALFLHFSRCKHPRTSAMRQHKYNIYIYIYQLPVAHFPYMPFHGALCWTLLKAQPAPAPTMFINFLQLHLPSFYELWNSHQ